MASALGSRETLAAKLVPRSNMRGLLAQHSSCLESGRDDGGIAGAPAEMAADNLLQVLLGRVGRRREIGVEGHEDSGGADPALQRMVPAEGSLEGREPVRGGGEALDRTEVAAFHLHCSCQTGMREWTVEGGS